MAKAELGTKRQCQNCGSRFYDLGKDPIICPKCGTIFQVAVLRSRAATARKEEEEEVEAEPETASAEFVPLEEADGNDDAKATPDDVEVDEDIGADEDETFLETDEEDGDDDVSDLIDGDIDEDDES